MVEELRLREDAGYIGVYGDQVFTHVLEFGFKNLRRAELDKAVGGELEGELPVELEDMVYTFEQIPAQPATGPMPAEAQVGRVAPPTEGMRVLTYAMRRDRANGGAAHVPCSPDDDPFFHDAVISLRFVTRRPSLSGDSALNPSRLATEEFERRTLPACVERRTPRAEY